MKKTLFLFMILSFLVFSLAGIAYSWQGRMAGMGDPYGLIMDESDFLIHPAGIAKGKGINFYGNYRFNLHRCDGLELHFEKVQSCNGSYFCPRAL